MGKNVNKFLSLFTLNDEDDYDEDDLFDEDDDEEEEDEDLGHKSSFSMSGLFGGKNKYDDEDEDDVDDDIDDMPLFKRQAKESAAQAKPASRMGSGNKLVSINSRPQKNYNSRGNNTVYVIKPQDFNEAQSVTDYLREGRAIVVNLEGIDINVAQRVIDFIGGSCYALDGTLQAISANIFIAAPDAVDVSGDLRSEILNEATVSPDLSRY